MHKTIFDCYNDFIARVVIGSCEEPHVIDLGVRTAEIPRINQNEIRNITVIYNTTHYNRSHYNTILLGIILLDIILPDIILPDIILFATMNLHVGEHFHPMQAT